MLGFCLVVCLSSAWVLLAPCLTSASTGARLALLLIDHLGALALEAVMLQSPVAGIHPPLKDVAHLVPVDLADDPAQLALVRRHASALPGVHEHPHMGAELRRAHDHARAPYVVDPKPHVRPPVIAVRHCSLRADW